MKSLLFFSLIIFSFCSLQAQKPSATILMNCDDAAKVAKVIIYRPFKLLGSALGFELYIKDSLLTKIRDKSFYVLELPAGNHILNASTGTLSFLEKNRSSLTLTIEPGKVYFVRCQPKSFSEGITKPKYKLLFKVYKGKEIRGALQHSFLRKRIRKKLYSDFYNLSS